MIRVRATKEAKGEPLVDAAAQVLMEELTRRRAKRVEVVLDLLDGEDDGFEIDGSPRGPIKIIAHRPGGLMPGVGKFLRTSRWTNAGLDPSRWRGASVPERPIRGIYFATHFHNFYHNAPLDEVNAYVRDLALWGCNTLAVWFDMHHYTGLADPAAKEMIRRLHSILRAAEQVGIAGALVTIGNEGYADSPQELRADWTAGHDGYTSEPGGHYHDEICPSKPGGLDYITSTRREMLRAFADLDIRFTWIWPYDQGGCTCGRCAPWGANGFLRTADAVAGVIGEVMPRTEIILSTWYFDHFTSGEWDGFAKAANEAPPKWLKYLLADDSGDNYPAHTLAHGAPGGAKLLNFPEISMYKSFPWGGYGANPLPRHIQSLWDSAGSKLSGGFPYSEGIYEDLNKAICLGHYWDGQDAAETVREYASNYFGSESVEAVERIVAGMEARHARSIALREDPAAAKSNPPGFPASAAFKCVSLSGAAETLASARSVEAMMPTSAKKDVRWRLLALRAEIDAELDRSRGRMTDVLDADFEELARIYHADRAGFPVDLPRRRMLRRYYAG